MTPVAASARFCDTESLSAGRARSFTPAATRHHFMRGAQKKTVFGPAGWFMKDWNLDADALAAAPDIFESECEGKKRRYGREEAVESDVESDATTDVCESVVSVCHHARGNFFPFQ